MTAIALTARRPPGELVGFAASLALHGLAVLAILLLAQLRSWPTSEPQVIEIIVESVAAPAPAEPAPESSAALPQVLEPEAAEPPASQQDTPPVVERLIAEPLPAPMVEPAPAPPRRKPMAEAPSRAAPAPATPMPAEPDSRAATAPAVAAPAPAVAPTLAQIEPSTPRYGAILLAWLERYRDYPRAARLRRQEGEVVLRLTVDRAGRLLTAEIAQPSGFAALDQAALDTVRRAAPLPPIPADQPGERLTLLVPVLFALAKG